MILQLDNTYGYFVFQFCKQQARENVISGRELSISDK